MFETLFSRDALTKRNIWILSEERPKMRVIEIILKDILSYDIQYSDKPPIIIPIITDDKFSFIYKVKNIKIKDFEEIYICTVKGESSFVDYMIFEKKEIPNIDDIPIALIEETKTDDSESRNVHAFQRNSKFAYASIFYPNVRKVMLYTNELKHISSHPTTTNVFGTDILLTLGVEIYGKNIETSLYHKFNSIEELINQKNDMPSTVNGQSIKIICKDDAIYMSAKLDKGKGEAKNKITHDPNIGAVTSIAMALRKLGFEKDIIVTDHNIIQSNVSNGQSKFWLLANKLNIKLQDIISPTSESKKNYWHYDRLTEKNGTIFIHVASETTSLYKAIYENHGGCERGYFYTFTGLFAIPKKINSLDVPIPDLIIRNDRTKEILIIEGKKSENIDKGISELNGYDIIEKEIIKTNYTDYRVSRWVVLFGNPLSSEYKEKVDEKVLLHLFNNGNVWVNSKAPEDFIKMIDKFKKAD